MDIEYKIIKGKTLNTTADVTEFLYSVREKMRIRRSIIHELERIARDVKVLRDVNAAVLHADKVQTSNLSNPTQDKALMIIDRYETKVRLFQDELNNIDLEIEEIKDDIENMCYDAKLTANEICVIKYFYFEGMSVEEIAIAMHYSEVWVKKTKSGAVRSMVL